MSRLKHIRKVWATTARLRLNLPDRIKFIIASSHGLANWLTRRGSNGFRVRFQERGKTFVMPLRLNEVDSKVAEDLFVNRPYDVQADNVRTILDLGGNIGLAALLFHARFPDAAIAIVEPAPHNIQCLKETVALNRIPATLFEAAVGIADGSVDLFIGGDPSAISTAPATATSRKITVRQMSIPSLMKQMGWDHIDLLKVDIEGYEKTLLSSANDWLRQVDVIVGEAHAHVNYGFNDVVRDLAPWGFQVTQTRVDSQYGMVLFEGRRQPARISPPR